MKRHLTTLGVGVLLVAAWHSTSHAGMEVIDPTSIIQETKTTSEIAKNGSMLQKGLEQGQDMLDKWGDLSSVNLEPLGNMGTLIDAGNAAAQACGIDGAIPDLSGIGIALPALPDLSCISSSISFVREALFASHSIGALVGFGKGNNPGDDLMTLEDIEEAKNQGIWNKIVAQTTENRIQMSQSLAENGLAVGMSNMTTAPQMAGTLSTAASFAAGSKNYATIMQLQTAQLRTLTSEMAKLRHLMAINVALQSAAMLRDVPAERITMREGEGGGGSSNSGGGMSAGLNLGLN